MQQEIERRQEYHKTSIACGTVNRPYADLRTGNFDLLPEFIGPEPGLINPLPDDASEVEWFLQIFDEDLIRFITRCTNRYARQRRRANARERQRSAWTPTTVVEMRAFIGVMVLFGICWQPEIQLYWSDHVCFGHNFVKRTFSRDRFKLLMRYLYYSTQPYFARNTAMYTAQKISEKRDRMSKVRNVIDRVNANSRMHRSPMCELATDQGVIPYLGRTKNVLYNPAKPHKYGMSVYTLSESATGYVLNDEVHQPVADNCHHPLDPDAADDPRVFRGNRPGKVVSRLIRPYYELGHHVIIMDSYYTSAPLFDHLYVHNIAATGTCRMNTLGLPDEVKNAANYDPQVVPPDADDEERWPRGSFSVFQDGAHTVCAWKDTKMVKSMSTAVSARRPNRALVRRRCKDKRTGAFERIEVLCPNVAVMYNHYFSGVDLTDQQLAYYTPGRSSPRWHRAVFYHELNKALMNAFHNMASVHGYGQSGSRYRRQLMFRAQVAKQLIGNFSSQQRPLRGTSLTAPRLTPSHVERVGHRMGRNPDGRRSCVMCRRAGRIVGHGTHPNRVHETINFCLTCQLPLCHPRYRQACWREHNV